MTELEIKVEALMRCVDPEKLRAALAEVTPAPSWEARLSPGSRWVWEPNPIRNLIWLTGY